MLSLKRSAHLYELVAAFAIVALAFLGAALIIQRSAARMDREVNDLQTNSLPSVEHLENAHNDLRALRDDIDELMWSGPGDGARETKARIAHERDAVDSELMSYGGTHWYPGEREIFESRLVPDLQQLDTGLTSLSDFGGERIADAEADRLDEVVSELCDLNYRESYAATTRILGMRQRWVRMSILLDVACAMVALVASFLAVRANKRFASVTAQNTELLSARARELESFAQRVAHDLLSPMSVVAFGLGNLAHRHPDAETKGIVDRASRALERSRRMVHGILDFSRSGARPTPDARAPLAAGIRAAVEEIVASEPDLPPRVEIEPFRECDVACDGAVLGVILGNLLGNAAKYMKGSATRRIAIRACVMPERVRVEVEDTGPGIPAGLEHRVFEPYVRGPDVTQAGLGLGLATVKRLVESHEGIVGVRRIDTGTIFWFELPRAKDRAPGETLGPSSEGEGTPPPAAPEGLEPRAQPQPQSGR
jgi:signal transduction histidine kinase